MSGEEPRLLQRIVALRASSKHGPSQLQQRRYGLHQTGARTSLLSASSTPVHPHHLLKNTGSTPASVFACASQNPKKYPTRSIRGWKPYKMSLGGSVQGLGELPMYDSHRPKRASPPALGARSNLFKDGLGSSPIASPQLQESFHRRGGVVLVVVVCVGEDGLSFSEKAIH